MHRRHLVKVVGSGFAFAQVHQQGVTQSTPAASDVLMVEGTWVTSNPDFGDIISLLEVKIERYVTDDDASDAASLVIDRLSVEDTFDGRLRSDSDWDISAFVNFTDGPLLAYEAFVQIGTLLYFFRWECPTFEGARVGQRLVDVVTLRAHDVTTVEELATLLPTDDELSDAKVVRQS